MVYEIILHLAEKKKTYIFNKNAGLVGDTVSSQEDM